MDEFKELLEMIKGGQITFRPRTAPGQDAPSESERADFQVIAKMLVYANEKGFLDGFEAIKESFTGNRGYEFVMVSDGLSHQGEEFLKALQQERGETTAEIIQLKPEFCGVSVDLKALWARWMSRDK